MCAYQNISDVRQSYVDPTIYLPIKPDAQRRCGGNKKGPNIDEKEDKFESDRGVGNQESSNQKEKNISGATGSSLETFKVNREYQRASSPLVAMSNNEKATHIESKMETEPMMIDVQINDIAHVEALVDTRNTCNITISEETARKLRFPTQKLIRLPGFKESVGI